VIDRAARLYARNAITLWRVVIPIVVVAEVAFTLINLSAVPSGSYVSNGVLYVPFGTLTGYRTIVELESLFNFVVIVQIIAGVLLQVYSQAYLGHRPDAGAALSASVRRIPGMVWIGIIYAIVVVIGLIGIVIGAVYLYVACSLAFAAYVVEGKSGFAALGRSRELVRGRWWPTFGALLLYGVVAAIAGFALPAVLAAVEHGSSVGVTAYIVLLRAVDLVTWVLVEPLGAAVTTTIYFDLRVRKEAFDIQTLSQQLGMTSTAAAAPQPDPFAATATPAFGAPPAAAAVAPPPAFGAPPPPPAEGAPPPWAAPAAPAPAAEPPAEDPSRADEPFGSGYL
jgi:hypothetical protein